MLKDEDKKLLADLFRGIKTLDDNQSEFMAICSKGTGVLISELGIALVELAEIKERYAKVINFKENCE